MKFLVTTIAIVSYGSLSVSAVDCTGVIPWDPYTTYSVAGMKVTYPEGGVNHLFQNQYWVQGSPPVGGYGGWTDLGACASGTDSGNSGSACATPWSPSQVYPNPGSKVSYNQQNWSNNWYTQGEVPGTSSVWANLGGCGGSGTPTQNPYTTTTPSYNPYTTTTPSYNPYTTTTPSYNPYTTTTPSYNPYATTTTPSYNPNGGGSSGHRDLYIYSDWQLAGGYDACQTAQEMANNGVSTIMGAFWVDPNQGLYDFASAWTDKGSDSCKSKAISSLQANGGRGVILSCGGATAGNFWTFDVNSYTQKACDAAKSGNFQGIDFDLENMAPGSASTYVPWLVSASKAAKSCIGWVSHAPQNPYFGNYWGFGDIYGQVIDQANDSIDKLLIQYYNQGSDPVDYQGLFVSDHETSIGELEAAHPAAKGKFVIGKPNLSYDASTGWVDANTLNQVVCQGEQQKGYRGGIMMWMDHGDNDSNGAYKALKNSCN